MISIWIRVRGFPMMLWQTSEFECLIEDFGAILLDQDHATVNYLEWRYARLKIGICDPKLIPDSHWIMYRDASGHVSRYDILFDIEHYHAGSYFNPSRLRSEGGTWMLQSGPKPPSGPGSISSGPSGSNLSCSDISHKPSQAPGSTRQNTMSATDLTST